MPEPRPLTDRQVDVLKLVDLYHSTLGEGCTSTFVAKKLSLHHQTVREHFAALYRKGWLISETCPATPRQHWLEISTYRLGFLTR